MRKQTVLILLVSAVTSGLVSVFVQKPTLITALWAATNTKAVVFVVGPDCPPGFTTTSAAGLGNWSSFYARFDESGAGAAVNSGLTTSTDGWHGHTQDTCVHGIGGGGPVPVACGGGGTSGAGSHNHTYEPKYVYLKPCVWTVN